MNAQIDDTDPIIAFIAWAMTQGVVKYLPESWLDIVRPFLPMVAVLFAVFARAMYDAAAGEPLTFEVVLRGIGAGAVAVLGHSQTRGLLKMGEEEE